jgi:hypothetical protein
MDARGAGFKETHVEQLTGIESMVDQITAISK